MIPSTGMDSICSSFPDGLLGAVDWFENNGLLSSDVSCDDPASGPFSFQSLFGLDGLPELTDDEDNGSKINPVSAQASQSQGPHSRRHDPTAKGAEERKLKKLIKEAENQCKKALKNQTIFSDFSFKQAALGKKQKEPQVDTDWQDGQPQSAYAADNYLLALYIPQFVKSKGQETLLDGISDYVKHAKPVIGKSASATDTVESYHEEGGLPGGQIAISRGWHAIGQRSSGDITPSSDILRSGDIFLRTGHLFKLLRPLSLRINTILHIADPVLHLQLTQLREKVAEKYPAIAALHEVDPLLFESRELLINKQSTLHTDSQDPQLGYAGIFVLGRFLGGEMDIPALRLKIRMQPGDFLLIRGRVLKHKIKDWTGDCRISIPHFTHTALWRKFGMADSVSLN